MNEAQLSQLVAAIVRGELLQSLPYFAVLFALIIIGAAAAAFGGSYLSERAKRLATQSDLQRILTQLKQTTETAEKIKAEVSHEDWKARERRSMRQRKLEELIYAVYARDEWGSKKLWQEMISGKQQDGTNPAYKVLALTNLYFPELNEVQKKFSSAFSILDIRCIQGRQQLLAAESEDRRVGATVNYTAALEAVQPPALEAFQTFAGALDAMKNEVSALMAKELA